MVASLYRFQNGPPYYPGLNPCDNILWRFLKHNLYKTSRTILKELKGNIKKGINGISSLTEKKRQTTS